MGKRIKILLLAGLLVISAVIFVSAEETDGSGDRDAENVSVKDEFYIMDSIPGLLGGKKAFEVICSISGDYPQDRTTGQAVSYGNPVFSIENFSAEEVFRYRLKEVSTNSLKMGEERVDFTADFSFDIDVFYEGIPIGTETVGPYSAKVSVFDSK